jgi:hypothetical protein
MKLTLKLEELSVDSFATAATRLVTGLDSSGWSCDSVCPTVDTHRCPP